MISRTKEAIQQHKQKERRANVRFPFVTEIRYWFIGGKGDLEEHHGTTVNISSRGVLFRADASVPVGRRLQLVINWPVKLNNQCGLKFFARGKVIRSEDTLVAVALRQYEFRTQGTKELLERE